jgi:NADH-ubiquinone oxidoreductase chain 6
MNNILLDFLSLLAILSSVLVITSKNPVIAVIFLISLFINTAVYLILLGIGFVGISYIIVYIGAITVLFLFIIMMLNIRLLDILEIGNEYTKNLPLALLVGSLFIFELFSIIPFSEYSQNNFSFLNIAIELVYNISGFLYNNYITSNSLPVVTLMSYSPDFIIGNFTQIQTLGQGLYTYGALWLLISSLILLLSMVSAIFISSNSSLENNNQGPNDNLNLFIST